MGRNIFCVTGTRAESGLFMPVFREIEEQDGLSLTVVATGMHLLEEHGRSISELQEANLSDLRTIEMYDESKRDMASYHGDALSRGIKRFTDLFMEERPDLLLVLGDRLEPFAAVLAAATVSVPVAHLHGGEETGSNHIDDHIRDSISRFAHVHFPARERHADRLRELGEPSDRTYRTGSPALDVVRQRKPMPKSELGEQLGVDFRQSVVVCLFHPVQSEKEEAGQNMTRMLDVLEEETDQTVVLYPNNDDGSQAIIDEIEKREPVGHIRAFDHLEHGVFLDLLRYADALIGNSSCGYIEAPSLNLPVVNVGIRNSERDEAPHVIRAKHEKPSIRSALKRVLEDASFRDRVIKMENPYGDGRASERIAQILKDVSLNESVTGKSSFIDEEEGFE